MLRHTDDVVWHTSSVMPSDRPYVVEVLTWLFRAGLQVKVFTLFKEVVIAYLGLALLSQQKPRRGG